MADQLCTTAQVKARLFPAGIADTTDDVLISELIDQSSGWIEQYTGRKLLPVTSATWLFDTEAGYVLRVPMGIRAVTLLEVATSHQPDSGGTYTTVAATDYILRPKAQDLDGWPFTEIQFSRGTLAGTISSFGRYQNGARVTATTGFAVTPVDIQAVAIDAVVAAFQQRKYGASSTMGADGDMTMPPWSKFFGRGSPQRGTLDRYLYRSV